MKYQHDLKVQYLPIGAIKPDPRNARTHSKKQVEQIRNTPSEIQPHFAQLLKILFFNNKHFAVKIASVWHQTTLYDKADQRGDSAH